MKPARFSYEAPTTVAGALAALAARGDEAKIIAGGQSLAPMLNMRLAQPGHLIDINGLAELEAIRVEANHLVIGALTRHAELTRHGLVKECAPMLAARGFGRSATMRSASAGRIGGSLAHADPAAQLPMVALALDASMEIACAEGRRLVPAAEFFVSIFTTALQPDELLTAVHIPLPVSHKDRREGWGFRLFARRAGDFALVLVAWSARRDRRSHRMPTAGNRRHRPDARSRRRRGNARNWRFRMDRLCGRWGGRSGRDRGERAHIGRVPPRAAGGMYQGCARRCDGALAVSEVQTVPVTLRVNGEEKRVLVEPRKLLSDTLREDCHLTGTHVGCEHGVCGACTVLVDGRPMRSCLLYAVQMAGPRHHHHRGRLVRRTADARAAGPA